jgi:hypothetical protein
MDVQAHSDQEVEDADFRQVVNTANTVIFPTDSSRGEIIDHLNNAIPTNEYGLPLFYIRSDLIDWSFIDAHGYLLQESADCASEALAYTEGYPTLRAGSPFWSRLPHEPQEAFVLFQRYIDLAELEGIRLIDTLATNERVELDHIRNMALEYYWSSRCRAYDLFIVAAEAKKREVRTRKTENSHFDTAGIILDRVVAKITSDPEIVEKMEAKDLFDLFEQMVKVQRLSLGLTGQNASTNTALPMTPGASVEVILRQLTQSIGAAPEVGESLQKRLALLMSDEGTAMQAQELIIRATAPSNTVYRGESGAPPP